jgi:hypothetical protein
MAIDYNMVKRNYDSDLYYEYRRSMRGVCQKFRHLDQLYNLSILDEIVFVYYVHEDLQVVVCVYGPCPYMSKMIKVSNDTMETRCCQKRYSLALLQELLYDSRFVIVSSLKEVEI